MTNENYLSIENYFTTNATCQVAILRLYYSLFDLPLYFMQLFDMEGFRLYLIQRGSKKGTVEFYINNLRRLDNGLKKLTLESINSFILDLIDKGKSSSYINDYIASIKIYSKWKGWTKFKDLKFIKEHPSIKETLSDSEIEAFLALPPPLVKHAFHGKMHEYLFMPEKYHKWTLFFKILAYSGMRCGEVAHLTINSIDFGRKIFILSDTKTNTPRFVPIAPNIEEELKEYVKKVSTKYIWGDRVPIDVEWGRRFHDRLKRLGIKRDNLTPYSFRHSFITRMLEEDVNIFKVQKIVGHKKIETTAQYTHLTTKDIQQAIVKHPIIRKSTSPQALLQFIEEALGVFDLEHDKRFDFLKVRETTHQFITSLYSAIK